MGRQLAVYPTFRVYPTFFKKIITLLYKFEFYLIQKLINCLARKVIAGTFKIAHFKYEGGIKKFKSI